MSKLRLLFAGTPEFAARILEDLDHHLFKPEAVFTQPDRPAGRGRKIVASPVKASALDLGITVQQPTTLKDPESAALVESYAPDLLIVVAYGLLLPKSILEIPTYGCLNVHASLLPRWRGAAPIERAYMAGDRETGVSIMQMDEGLDTGPVFTKKSFEIGTASIAEVEDKMGALGCEALRETLALFSKAKAGEGDTPIPIPQPTTGANYAKKLSAQDRKLDFGREAKLLARQVNALSERVPVRITIAGKNMQLLAATERISEQSPQQPGCVVSLDKSGLCLQTATHQLLIQKAKFEGGKGTVLDGAALMNGYAQLLQPGVVAS